MDETNLRNRGQILSHTQQKCLFCNHVAEIEELRQHIVLTHNQTGPYPQPTAQRDDSEDSWFFSIVLGFISTNLPQPLAKALSLLITRHFFPRVSWKVVLVMGIFAVILGIWIWQATVNLASNAIAMLQSFVSNVFACGQPLANIASATSASATYFLCYVGISSKSCEPPTPHIFAEFRKGVDFSSRLAEMQNIGAINYEIPHSLQTIEGKVGSMIVQLSVIEMSSKYTLLSQREFYTNMFREKYLPLLNEYREHSAAVIEGLIGVFAVIDHCVDETVHTTIWAKNRLLSISEPSMFTKFKDLFVTAHPTEGYTSTDVALPRDNLTGEARIRQLFIKMTDMIQQRLSGALEQLVQAQERLHSMQSVFYNVARYAVNDKYVLDAQKMKDKSFWKGIFQEYRLKMSDYEEKMKTAAAFYNHTEEGTQVIRQVLLKMTEIKTGLGVFRNTLQDAPIKTEDPFDGTLQLYLDILSSSIGELEESRRLTKRVKKEKRAQLEASRSGKPKGEEGVFPISHLD